MAALSPFLRKHCSEVLKDSHLVDSKGDLEDIFTIPELFSRRSSIPDADNSEARVRKTITMLLGLNTEEEGPQLFLVFLRNVIFLSGLPATSGWYRELSECCALVEIEHVLTAMGDENRYNLRDVANLVAYFHRHPYLDEDDKYHRVLQQLPNEIVGNVRIRLPDFDIPAVVRIFIACLSTPDGVGQLASALYQLDHESQAWRELDSLVRELDQVDVTYARLQQLQSLLERMKLPLNVLSDAYRASAPEASVIPDGDETTLLPAMLSELGKLPDASNVLPILEFATQLAQYAGQQQRQDIQVDVESWIKARAQELGKNVPQYMSTLNARLQDPAPTPVAYLLIVVDPYPAVVEPGDEQTFEVRAWLLNKQNRQAEKTERYLSTKLVPSEGIPGCIGEIRRKYAAYLSVDLIIEVFLSDKDLLCRAIDHWQVDSGRAKRKFGIMHKLVVRSLDRLQDIIVLNAWRQKWNVFQKFVHDSKFEGDGNYPGMKDPFWVCEEQDYINGDALFGVLNISPVVCLTMGFVPSSPEEWTEILRAIFEAGIPILLWPREPIKSLRDSFAECKAQLRRLFHSPQELLNLPTWVLAQRVEAVNVGEGHHGHHLTLLWDDPNRLPPDIAGKQFVYQR